MKLELIMLLPLLLVGVVLQFSPLLTRRGIFFSATVDPGFPQSEDGRRILRSYRLQTALWTVVAVVLMLLLFPVHPATSLVAMLVAIAGSGFSYWRKFREVHERYGMRAPEIRTADLSAQPRGEDFSLALCLPPFLAIGVVALFLQSQWSRLPEIFPVHWGADGQPNGWAHRDPKGVFGPLLMCVAMNLFLLGTGWVIARLSRRTVMRHVTVRSIQFMLYPLTFVITLVALLPLLSLPLWLSPAVMLASIAGIVYWSYRQLTAPGARDAVPEPQSDSYWKAGMFYYNPNDPAIFVSKRVGIGYTMNFANKMSWVVLAGMLLIALLPALLLRMK
jgi:uncharacterized membrane protein